MSTLLDVSEVVFVDAAIPLQDGKTTPLAPPGLIEQLQPLVDADGILPPWTEWWDDVSDLFPDTETRRLVESQQPRLQLSYFSSRLPVPDWSELPCAYLAFGDTYAEELTFAMARGWPTRTLQGGHLHQLREPEVVMASILGLADELHDC